MKYLCLSAWFLLINTAHAIEFFNCRCEIYPANSNTGVATESYVIDSWIAYSVGGSNMAEAIGRPKQSDVNACRDKCLGSESRVTMDKIKTAIPKQVFCNGFGGVIGASVKGIAGKLSSSVVRIGNKTWADKTMCDTSSKNKCPEGVFDGANCRIRNVPADAFFYGTGSNRALYFTPLK